MYAAACPKTLRLELHGTPGTMRHSPELCGTLVYIERGTNECPVYHLVFFYAYIKEMGSISLYRKG